MLSAQKMVVEEYLGLIDNKFAILRFEKDLAVRASCFGNIAALNIKLDQAHGRTEEWRTERTHLDRVVIDECKGQFTGFAEVDDQLENLAEQKRSDSTD